MLHHEVFVNSKRFVGATLNRMCAVVRQSAHEFPCEVSGSGSVLAQLATQHRVQGLSIGCRERHITVTPQIVIKGQGFVVFWCSWCLCIQ